MSWVAQLTAKLKSIGVDVSTYANQGISGATPSDFLSGGSANSILTETVAADPTLTFMTLGGNPLLGDVLFGLKDCEADRKAGKLYDCVTGLINNTYKVPERLASIYEELLKAPANHVVVSSYMSAGATYFPFNNYSVGEFTVIARAINDAIGRAVDAARAKVGASANGRLLLVAPVAPPLGVAQANGPVECKRGNNAPFRADGSSVLATVVQVDMSISSQANRFCGKGAEVKVGSEWKAAGTDPWFNSADLGTHLTTTGQPAASHRDLQRDAERPPRRPLTASFTPDVAHNEGPVGSAIADGVSLPPKPVSPRYRSPLVAKESKPRTTCSFG